MTLKTGKKWQGRNQIERYTNEIGLNGKQFNCPMVKEMGNSPFSFD